MWSAGVCVHANIRCCPKITLTTESSWSRVNSMFPPCTVCAVAEEETDEVGERARTTTLYICGTYWLASVQHTHRERKRQRETERENENATAQHKSHQTKPHKRIKFSMLFSFYAFSGRCIKLQWISRALLRALPHSFAQDEQHTNTHAPTVCRINSLWNYVECLACMIKINDLTRRWWYKENCVHCVFAITMSVRLWNQSNYGGC